MDNSELHYVTYDPEALWDAMILAYVDAGGDILYPGDEKEMLLRAVQMVLVQALAQVDNQLRQATRRYAVGEFLDLYGEKRDCYRIQAAAATAEVEISIRETGKPKTIYAGSALTADGAMFYELASDVICSGFAQTVRAQIVCSETGSAGNGLRAETQMQFVNTEEGVVSVVVKRAASGGMSAEDDESYRTRIGEYGLGNVTTGPSAQYESGSMATSSDIIDAHAKRTADGEVGIYLILKPEADFASIQTSVLARVNPRDVRPLTDKVSVYQASKVEYKLAVQYAADSGSDVTGALNAAVSEYKSWQESKIGRAFNPDKLMASLYNAGATRVIWGPESQFRQGDVQYTEIADTEYCSGEITLAVMGG